MFERDKDQHNSIVVAAFVIFLMIFSMIGYFQGLEKGQFNNAQVDAKHHHENTAQYIETTCVGRDHKAFVECVDIAIKTSGEYQRAEHDLAAQQQMAEFAKWLLILTMFTSGITGLGVYYVKRTLDQTSETNSAALTAASAALESNAIMRMESRPWLRLSISPAIEFKKVREARYAQLTFRWNFNNVGRGPAYNVRRIAKISSFDYIDEFEDRDRVPHFIGTMDSGTRHEIQDISNVVFRGEVNSITEPNIGLEIHGDRAILRLYFAVAYDLDPLGNDSGYEVKVFKFEFRKGPGPFACSLVDIPVYGKIG